MSEKDLFKKLEKPRQALMCLECGAILVSLYTHHFNRCGCPNELFLDGGDSYGRWGGHRMNNTQWLTVSPVKTKAKKVKKK